MTFNIIKPFILIFPLIFTACGGGGGGGGAVSTVDPVSPQLVTPQLQIAALEANGTLPKLDRSIGLAGPDTNANGIRDDVEAYIETSYTTPAQRAAVQQIAAVLQAALLVDTTNTVAVRSISSRSSRAVNCIYKNFNGKNGSKQPAIVASEIESLTMNTKPRLLKYLAYSKALDGATMAMSEGNTCE